MSLNKTASLHEEVTLKVAITGGTFKGPSKIDRTSLDLAVKKCVSWSRDKWIADHLYCAIVKLLTRCKPGFYDISFGRRVSGKDARWAVWFTGRSDDRVIVLGSNKGNPDTDPSMLSLL